MRYVDIPEFNSMSKIYQSHILTDYQVVGGGVVGLAIARQLAARGEPTILIEKHGAVGTETSSRNSEVGTSIPVLLVNILSSFLLSLSSLQ